MMPSPVAFRPRWNFARDDSAFPALTEAFIRFLWFLHSTIICHSDGPRLIVNPRIRKSFSTLPQKADGGLSSSGSLGWQKKIDDKINWLN
ncbi:unnamed protein product [Anisakis simplex]|uniref:Uncharacterized protein n=1 Tax=Anisakis simplex TaxID=6269 RepID=A0A3P6P152_ANISI|nr:unnamed protein product [Anisakis simplex]